MIHGTLMIDLMIRGTLVIDGLKALPDPAPIPS
jgi:hypothetical protein